MKLDLGGVVQHGYVVSDIEASAHSWVRRVGAGPFYLVDVALNDYCYRGLSAECRLRIAFGYWGTMQIELIQPLSKTDSLYTRALQHNEDGLLNHCATWVSDLDRLLVEKDLLDSVLQSGCAPGGVRFVYLDQYLPGGHHLELIQPTENLRRSAHAMQMVTREWDGRDVLRSAIALEKDFAALKK